MLRFDDCVLLRGMLQKLILTADPRGSVLVFWNDSWSPLSCCSFFGYYNDDIKLKKKHPRSVQRNTKDVLLTRYQRCSVLVKHNASLSANFGSPESTTHTLCNSATSEVGCFAKPTARASSALKVKFEVQVGPGLSAPPGSAVTHRLRTKPSSPPAPKPRQILRLGILEHRQTNFPSTRIFVDNPRVTVTMGT
jgi:hypothetical protein